LRNLVIAPALDAYPGPQSTPTLPNPTPVDTAVPAPFDCQTPPPWSDQATAERCHSFYPPPFGGVIVEGCQVGYSALGDLICYGYWINPDAVYPWLTETPAVGFPTPWPSSTPAAYPAPPTLPPTDAPAPYPMPPTATAAAYP
jgi:hypothetical protein